MTAVVLAVAVFLAAYLLNVFYVTVLYHRGLTHGAVTLGPFLRWMVVHTGNWVTGLDPKGWSTMHRLHHAHSDTELDPHSPKFNGVIPLMLVQLRSYNRVLSKLIRKDDEVTRLSRDLDFEVSWLNRHHLWILPYALHAGIGLSLAVFGGWWLIGASYWLGMMSHPIQGWLVNAFAHKYGSRNFETNDDSRNNAPVAWLVFGEGYQNNHHAFPRAANFAMRSGEVDLGYGLCLVCEKLGLLDIAPLPDSSGATPELG